MSRRSRKLVRRLGPEVIEQITRAVIAGATTGERRFVARAARIDSTVVEADIRYPTDLGLAADAPKVLAREASAPVICWAATVCGCGTARAPSRSGCASSTGRWLRAPARASRRRCGCTGEAGQLVERSIRETRRVADRLRRGARGRGAQAKLAAARRLDELTDRAAKVTRQIRQRLAGERITDRLVSIS